MPERLPPPPVAPGDLLDHRYRLVTAVGRGGMATVWEAIDERLDRTVAVKLLSPSLLVLPWRAQLRSEAQALAHLRHPHIAEVYDCATADLPPMGRVPFLVMEFIEGVPLNERLAGGGRLAWQQAAAVTAQTAAALAAAHERGIVHRDIAPANIILTLHGVKLIDFGICAAHGDTTADPEGLLLGTPAFLAPERIDGEPVLPANDVYALGVLLYRMLTGRLPFNAASDTELMDAHRFEAPPPLGELGGIPHRLASACLSCLDKDPDRRPDAGALADEMAEVAGAVLHRPSEHAAVQDTVLTLLTDSLPRPRPAQRRLAQLGRPAPLMAAATAIVGAGVTWMLLGGAASPAPAASGSPAVQPAEPACSVVFRIVADDGHRFTAYLTVTNLTDRPADPAALSFTLTPQQQLDPTMAGLWTRDGDAIGSQPGLFSLAPREAVQLTLTAGYSSANPLPTRFQVNQNPCLATVYGIGGVPLVTPTKPGTTPSASAPPARLITGPSASLPGAPGTPAATSSPTPSDAGPPPVPSPDPTAVGRSNGRTQSPGPPGRPSPPQPAG